MTDRTLSVGILDCHLLAWHAQYSLSAVLVLREHLPYVAWGAVCQRILKSCCVKGPRESKWIVRNGGPLFSY